MLPSARVLEAMERDHDNSFIGFMRAQIAQATRQALLALPFGAAQRTRFERTDADARSRSRSGIEASDSMPFEIYRQQYVSPERLGFKNHWAETPAEPVSQRAAL